MFWSYVPGYSVYLVLSLSTLGYIYCSFSWRVVWILTESWRQMFFLSSSVLTNLSLVVVPIFWNEYQNLSVQCSSGAQSCPTLVTPWISARQASLSITNSTSLSKTMSIVSVMPFNHLILCHPLLLMPSIFLNIRVFSEESALHTRWPKYWSFSFNISTANEHPRLISFRMDWLDLLAVQETLKSLLQYHSSKASIVWHSDFFIVQLSHPYMTIGQNHSFD